MASRRLVNKENFEEMKSKFYSPVAKPAQNQRIKTQGGPLAGGLISPDYQKSKYAQRDVGLTGGPQFYTGLKGSAGRTRINSQRTRYERERRAATDELANIGAQGENLRELQIGRQSFTANQATQTRRNTLADQGLARRNTLADMKTTREQSMQDQLFKTLTTSEGLNDADWIKYHTAASKAFENALTMNKVLAGEDIQAFITRTDKNLANRLYGDAEQSIGGIGLQAIKQGSEEQTLSPDWYGSASRSDGTEFSSRQIPLKTQLNDPNYLQKREAKKVGGSNLKNIGENVPRSIDQVTGLPRITPWKVLKRMATETQEMWLARKAEEAAITKEYQGR